jgi:protein-S-isoprenylcysteine O-methyltransferase Ste14
MPQKRRIWYLAPLIGAGAGAIVGVLFTRNRQGPALSADFLRVLPAIILWAIFFIYWSFESRNAAPTKSSESWWSSQFHQLLLGAALLMLILPDIPGLAGRFVPISPLFVVLGLTTQASFLLLAVWARRHLGRNWSAEVRIAVDHQLVRTGPYRFLRHPIYTAMLGMFAGTAITSGQYHALVAVLVMAAAYWRKIRLEEQVLEKTFGADFDAYRRATWALVPPLF